MMTLTEWFLRKITGRNGHEVTHDLRPGDIVTVKHHSDNSFENAFLQVVSTNDQTLLCVCLARGSYQPDRKPMVLPIDQYEFFEASELWRDYLVNFTSKGAVESADGMPTVAQLNERVRRIEADLNEAIEGFTDDVTKLADLSEYHRKRIDALEGIPSDKPDEAPKHSHKLHGEAMKADAATCDPDAPEPDWDLLEGKKK